MNIMIYALGQDKFWLSALHQACTYNRQIKSIHCAVNISGCIVDLPVPQKNAVILLDASGQSNIAQSVKVLRDKGWKFVVVVAADPSVKEAVSVLRMGMGYDYWKKTYVVQEIADAVEECLDEVEKEIETDDETRRAAGRKIHNHSFE